MHNHHTLLNSLSSHYIGKPVVTITNDCFNNKIGSIKKFLDDGRVLIRIDEKDVGFRPQELIFQYDYSIEDLIVGKRVKITTDDYNGALGYVTAVTDNSQPFTIYLDDIGETDFCSTEFTFKQEN